MSFQSSKANVMVPVLSSLFPCSRSRGLVDEADESFQAEQDEVNLIGDRGVA